MEETQILVDRLNSKNEMIDNRPHTIGVFVGTSGLATREVDLGAAGADSTQDGALGPGPAQYVKHERYRVAKESSGRIKRCTRAEGHQNSSQPRKHNDSSSRGSPAKLRSGGARRES